MSAPEHSLCHYQSSLLDSVLWGRDHVFLIFVSPMPDLMSLNGSLLDNGRRKLSRKDSLRPGELWAFPGSEDSEEVKGQDALQNAPLFLGPRLRSPVHWAMGGSA